MQFQNILDNENSSYISSSLTEKGIPCYPHNTIKTVLLFCNIQMKGCNLYIFTINKQYKNPYFRSYVIRRLWLEIQGLRSQEVVEENLSVVSQLSALCVLITMQPFVMKLLFRSQLQGYNLSVSDTSEKSVPRRFFYFWQCF